VLDVAEHHPTAFLDEASSGRCPESARRTRDRGHLAFQSLTHVRLPRAERPAERSCFRRLNSIGPKQSNVLVLARLHAAAAGYQLVTAALPGTVDALHVVLVGRPEGQRRVRLVLQAAECLDVGA